MLQATAAALMILCPMISLAQTPQNEMRSHFQIFMENFKKDPKATMDALPAKYDAQGNLILDASVFSNEQIQNRSFVTLKDQLRSKITFDPASLMMAQIDRENEPKSLFINSRSTNFRDLTKANLQNGEVQSQPWSSDYWATYRGGLSLRYGNSNFTNFESWVQFKPMFSQLISVNFQDPVSLDDRSPAEKYDLLMGDDNFNFTKWWVKKAINSEDSRGNVETWQGICHGWAPASYLLPRPAKTISFTLKDGQVLRFFPDDLKALADTLYANNKTAAAFVGKRCNEKAPQEDENGRILSSACWDLNPASFHAILLNRVGADKKSLVMDATYDYEVWNQPIVRYHAAYFNPKTSQWTNDPQQAIVSRKDFTAANDPFAKYRSPNAVAMMGVQMSVTYTVETYADHAATDSVAQDVTRTTEYMYDLELDKDGNIIGGEWYQNAHPDFMWSPLESSKPLAFSEPALYLSWNPLTGLPTDQTKELATRASGAGQVLYSVVQKMMQMSASGN